MVMTAKSYPVQRHVPVTVNMEVPPPPPPGPLTLDKSSYQLVPPENEDLFFWGGGPGGGACQLKMLVPPYKNPRPPCAPSLEKS